VRSVREKSGPDAREGDHPAGSAAKEGDTLASIRAGFEAGFTIKAGIDRRRREKGNNVYERDESRRNAPTTGQSGNRLRWRAAGKAEKELHMADDDLDEGPVVVKHAVYDAGMKLEAEEKAGKGTAFTIAEDKATACRAAGDTAGAAFWDEVFRFTMTRECVAAGTETVILEEGETWDYDNEEVIRAPGTSQPQSPR
jgi:hypothetical protein